MLCCDLTSYMYFCAKITKQLLQHSPIIKCFIIGGGIILPDESEMRYDVGKCACVNGHGMFVNIQFSGARFQNVH